MEKLVLQQKMFHLLSLLIELGLLLDFEKLFFVEKRVLRMEIFHPLSLLIDLGLLLDF